jgi:hypothetical protein
VFRIQRQEAWGGPRTLRELETGKGEALGITETNASLDGHSGAGGQALDGKDASECVIDPAVSIVPRCRKARSQRWRSIGVHWSWVHWSWASGELYEFSSVVVHVELERK